MQTHRSKAGRGQKNQSQQINPCRTGYIHNHQEITGSTHEEKGWNEQTKVHTVGQGTGETNQGGAKQSKEV